MMHEVFGAPKSLPEAATIRSMLSWTRRSRNPSTRSTTRLRGGAARQTRKWHRLMRHERPGEETHEVAGWEIDARQDTGGLDL